jgi:hypothetical protein
MDRHRNLIGRGPAHGASRTEEVKASVKASGKANVRADASAQARAYERRLVRVVLARDPARALRAAASDGRLPEGARRAFSRAHPDGVRMTAWLVARLRFACLLRGSREARSWQAKRPAWLAETFQRYHAAVLPRVFAPAVEAEQFRAWCRATAATPARALRAG